MAEEKSGRRWSGADEAKLRELAERNTPTRLVALKLQRTEGGIRNRASELGVPLKPTNQSPYGTNGRRRGGK